MSLSLAGPNYVRVFHGATFRWLRVLRSSRVRTARFYDATSNLIYFGYCGQSAGFDAYERVGVPRPKLGTEYDQLVADMVAPTPVTSPRSRWTTTEYFSCVTFSRAEPISSPQKRELNEHDVHHDVRRCEAQQR
jgi:hypothetical protein